MNRRLWLMLVPLALSLALWFGPQLSFAPLLERLAALLREVPAQPGVTLQLTPEQVAEFSKLDMRQPLTGLNFIPTLTLYLVSAASDDSVSGLPIISAVPQLLRASGAVQVSSIAEGLLAVVLLNGVMLLLSAGFLTALAAAVRDDRAPLGTWLRRSGRSALAILGYIGAIGGVALAISFPFAFFASLLMLVSPAFGGLVLSLLFILWFWVQIYLGFAREAIVISGIGPLQAIRASFNIVRRNLWGTLGLLGLSFVIEVGTGVLWHNLAGSDAGLLVAIGASAYLGTGLAAARMAFYRQQLQRWQASTSPVRPAA